MATTPTCPDNLRVSDAERVVPIDGAGEPSPAAPFLHELHLRMVGAVISGGGLDRLAELAHAELSAPVAIVVPRVGEALAGAEERELGRLRGYVRDRLAKRTTEVPESVLAEVP